MTLSTLDLFKGCKWGGRRVPVEDIYLWSWGLSNSIRTALQCPLDWTRSGIDSINSIKYMACIVCWNTGIWQCSAVFSRFYQVWYTLYN